MEANITRTEHNVADYCTAAYGGSREGQLDYTAASVQNEATCRSQKFRVEDNNIDSNCQPCMYHSIELKIWIALYLLCKCKSCVHAYKYCPCELIMIELSD